MRPVDRHPRRPARALASGKAARRRLIPIGTFGMVCGIASALAGALAGGQMAQAQDFAVTNATVAIGDGSDPITGGTVVVRGGRIVAAGAGIAVPAGVPAIDAGGGWVTPGIVASTTDLGLYDVGAVRSSNDIEAGSSPFSAALDVVPALNPLSQHVAISRAGGVTRASVTPLAGSSIFAGQGAIVDLGQDANMVVAPRAFQYVELGETGGRLAGGSRTAAQALFRNALREARDLSPDAGISGTARRPEDSRTGDDLPIDPRLDGRNAERSDDVLLTRFDATALRPVVAGSQPLYVHVERAADIRSVLALRREFPNLRLVLVGADEGWMVAREIAAAGVPVIASAMHDRPEQFEQLAATQSNVGRMADAGVRVAIGNFSDHDQPRYALQYAGNMVALTKVPGATGLSWGRALAAITSVPAEIMGMGGRFGSLKPGLAGDVVIWDGDPLEVTSAPTRVFIDGVEQPFDNHQTRLRERYRNLDETRLPKAYDW